MSWIGFVVLFLIVAFVSMQVSVALRARKMQGKDVGALPGDTGGRIAGHARSLVYFFSPTCGACRAITPIVESLAKDNDAVFAVDVMQDMPLARALGVMATPSTVEIEGGKIVGYHIGAIPGPVLQRFAKA